LQQESNFAENRYQSVCRQLNYIPYRPYCFLFADSEIFTVSGKYTFHFLNKILLSLFKSALVPILLFSFGMYKSGRKIGRNQKFQDRISGVKF
jgi:hypothetical protein